MTVMYVGPSTDFSAAVCVCSVDCSSFYRWAGCGLLSLSLFGVGLLCKVIAVILGAVWIFGKDGMQCVSQN